MGLGIYPIFNPRQQDIVFDSDGVLLLRYHQLLDQVAERVGVQPLHTFGDDRELPANFTGRPEEIQNLLGPYDRWHSPAQGLQTVEALRTALKPSDLRGAAEEFDPIIAELQELAQCLQQACDRGVGFRLEIG